MFLTSLPPRPPTRRVCDVGLTDERARVARDDAPRHRARHMARAHAGAQADVPVVADVGSCCAAIAPDAGVARAATRDSRGARAVWDVRSRVAQRRELRVAVGGSSACFCRLARLSLPGVYTPQLSPLLYLLTQKLQLSSVRTIGKTMSGDHETTGPQPTNQPSPAPDPGGQSRSP